MMLVVVLICLVLFQGAIGLVLWRVMRSFGVYTQSLTRMHRETMALRYQLAAEQNQRATEAILHTHRRSTDPESTEELRA